MADDIAVLGLKVESGGAIRDLKAFKGELGSVADAAKQAGAIIASAFVGSKIVGLGNQLLNAASQAQGAERKFQTIFKSYAAQAAVTVRELNQSFAYSITQAQNYMSTMADTFQQAGVTIARSEDYSASLTKLSSDILAFTKAEGGIERVSGAVSMAMLGQTRSLRSLGITIMDTDIKQKMAENSAKGLASATGNAAVMQARFDVIMEKAANILGYTEKAATGYSHRVRDLIKEILDFKAALGEALFEPMKKVLSVGVSVMKWMNGLSEGTKNAIVYTGALGAAILTVGVPLAKLIVGYRMYTAVQGINVTAQKASVMASDRQVVAKNAEATASNIAAAATSKQTAAIVAQTVAVNANAASLKRMIDVGGIANVAALPLKRRVDVRGIQKNAFGDTLNRRSFEYPQAPWAGYAAGMWGSTFRRPLLEAGMNAQGSQLQNRKNALSSLKPSDFVHGGDHLRNQRNGGLLSSVNVIGGLSAGAKNAAVPSTSTAYNSVLVNSLNAERAKHNSRGGKIDTSFDLGIMNTKVVPLLGRLGGMLKLLIKPLAIVLGTLELFRHAPKWLEGLSEWADGIAKWMREDMLSTIESGIKSGWDATVNWLGESLLGIGQTFKRLLTYSETEVTREIRLTRELEAINKKREEMAAATLKYEQQRLTSQQFIADQENIDRQAYMGYLDERATDPMKLLSAQRKLGEIELKRQEKISQRNADELRLKLNGVNAADKNEKLAESIKTLSNELKDLGTEWTEQAKIVDELSTSVSDAWKQAVKDQTNFTKTIRENDQAMRESTLARAYSVSRSDVGRLAAIRDEIAYRKERLGEADLAGRNAVSINAGIDRKQAEYFDAGKNGLLAQMQKIASGSGESMTPEVQRQFIEMIKSYTGKPTGLAERDLTPELMEKIYSGFQSEREELKNVIERLIEQRDQQQEIANTKQSHVDAINTAEDQRREIGQKAKDKEFGLLSDREQISSLRLEINGYNRQIGAYRRDSEKVQKLTEEIADLGGKKELTPEEKERLKFAKRDLYLGWEQLGENEATTRENQDKRGKALEKMDELLRPIAERNYEEVSAARKAAGNAIHPQAAMEEGSAAAFQIANRIHNQYQQNMENHARNIASYLKAMKDKMFEDGDGGVVVLEME